MTLDVLAGGFLTTVQDGGRRGYERFGVPPAGAMDSFAAAAANLLVGNDPGAAVLEMVISGPELFVWHDCLVALAGGGFGLSINSRDYPAWMSVLARAGSTLRFPENDSGQWGYLAVSGGFDLPALYGSHSTYLRGGFGGFEGRALKTGDRLNMRACPVELTLQAGIVIPPPARPPYIQDPLVRVIPAGQMEAFTADGLAAFFDGAYRLLPTSDRMGYRFNGPRVAHSAGADILSDGVVTGTIQVPADGQPLVMMSDRQTTGGYTRLGAVARVDLPVLAQCRPGVSQVRFTQISVEEAQSLYRAQMKMLRAALIDSSGDQLRYHQF